MPQKIERVAVIGLGTMGHGIAQAFAAGGCQVRGYDHTEKTRRGLTQRIRSNLQKAAEAGLCDPKNIEPTLGRITIAETETDAVEGAQLVIEAVREELSVKQALFARIEQAVAPQTILATNTSSLRVTPMTAHLRHRERVVVAHWFNPPHIVPVVEVVPAETTSDGTMQAMMDLLRSIGKRPVRLKRDIPGFLVNRVQTAMIREVWSLLSNEVADAADIDAAIQGSMGFRLAACGPLQIADFGGLDVWAAFSKISCLKLNPEPNCRHISNNWSPTGITASKPAAEFTTTRLKACRRKRPSGIAGFSPWPNSFTVERSAHGRDSESHHQLRRHRLDPHAQHVPASADHAAADRRQRHRGSAGRGRHSPPACPPP
jgi:3-hydroxybutyryl-CoA dehydrogenase